MKKSSHNISEPIEKQQFKKKYIERQLEEKDAERQIREYKKKVLQTDEMSDPSSVDS